jgi:glycosyltransferase involved in cell wall biosynthesis
MPQREPPLIIADPGLRGPSGHHPAAVRALLQGAQGMRPAIVYAHQDADSATEQWLAQPGVRFQRLFSLYLYQPGLLERTMSAALVDVRTLAAEYAQVLQAARSVAAGRRRANAAPLIVHHTVDWLQAAALSYLLRHTPPADDPGAPRHLVFLTFAPGVDHTGQVHDPRRLLNWRIALAGLKSRADVSLCTSCEEYRHTYATFCGLGERITVHPAFHFDAPAWAAAARPRRRNPPLLLYVGDAKEAKGFGRLPHLARQLIDTTALNLVIQFGLEEGLRSRALDAAAAALQALAAAHPRRLKLQRGYVTEAELQALMLGSAGMVFHYHAGRYADQTSGVLWQAAAARLPCWFVGESWLTREARRLLPRMAVAADEAALLAALRAFAAPAHAKPDLVDSHSAAHSSRAAGPAELQPCEVDAAYRQALFSPIHSVLTAPQSGVGATPGREAQAQALDGRLVLVIDAQPPAPVRNAGHHAAWQEMLLLRGLGLRVCVAATGSQAPEPGIPEALAAQGLEWLGGPAALGAFLRRHGPAVHIVYITRFHVAEQVLPAVRQAAAQARVLLNLADLHHLRLEREALLTGRADLLRHAQEIRQRECAVMAQVDTVLTYTEEEATLIHAAMRGRVRVERLPWVAEPRATPVPGPQGRSGLLFVGAFAHAPNVDGLLWFAREVMPLLRQRLPGIHLRVCGGDAPPAVQALQGPDITIEGFVEDLGPVMDQCRLLVAPLRFGAGIKGKVAAALSAGLPVVASPVAAEGFVEAGEMGVAAIAQTAEEWVGVIASLAVNDSAWRRLSDVAMNGCARSLALSRALDDMRDVLR